MKKQPNPWIQTLTLTSAAAVAIALLIGIAGGASGKTAHPQSPSLPSSQSQSPLPQEIHEGMVTDSRCGAKHSAAIAKNASNCVLICVHGGAKFALIEGDEVYILDGDVDQVKKVAGQRAKITGAVNGNTIEVSSVVAGS